MGSEAGKFCRYMHPFLEGIRTVVLVSAQVIKHSIATVKGYVVRVKQYESPCAHCELIHGPEQGETGHQFGSVNVVCALDEDKFRHVQFVLVADVLFRNEWIQRVCSGRGGDQRFVCVLISSVNFDEFGDALECMSSPLEPGESTCVYCADVGDGGFVKHTFECALCECGWI